MLVIGQKELESNAVSVRIHGQGDQGVKPVAEALSGLNLAIGDRIL